jgi:spore germination protein GerM
VLAALLQGPSAEEQRRGIRSLIPPAARLLRTEVQGSTAYVSFSDDFQYSEFGVEGYVGQLRQIIWTVTEFSNLRDVQFLIEGRRVDYLGEGVWIGSPLNRESL